MCDGNGAVKKPVVATGKPLRNRVPQATPQFVQEKRATASEASTDSTSFQDITSQSKGKETVRIHEEESKSSTAVIKEVKNDDVDQIDDGKVNICDNDHDSALLSSVDHDEMNGMPANTEFNKSSVQLEREVELRADAVAEGMDASETISVIDQRVAHLSTDNNNNSIFSFCT
ncbi:unnamed protein product [Trichobilharzia regenti]|nr:unnamed protein product [Trichobilharzia regenti]